MLKTNIDYSSPFKRLVASMFHVEMCEANKTEKGSHEAYECIPLSATEFCEGVNIVITQNKGIKTFIDVGAGLCEKVYLAASVFNLEASGVELRSSYIPKAEELLTRYLGITRNGQKKNFNIFQGDARFQDYSDYNLIYFYRPAPDKKIQAEIEMQIAKTAKVGTVVLGYLAEIFSQELATSLAANLGLLGWVYIDTGTENEYGKRICYWKRISNKPIKIDFKNISRTVCFLVKECHESYEKPGTFYFCKGMYGRKQDDKDQISLKEICIKYKLPAYYKHVKPINPNEKLVDN